MCLKKVSTNSVGNVVELYGPSYCFCVDVKGIVPRILPSTINSAVMSFICAIMTDISLSFWQSCSCSCLTWSPSKNHPFRLHYSSFCCEHRHTSFIFSFMISIKLGIGVIEKGALDIMSGISSICLVDSLG